MHLWNSIDVRSFLAYLWDSIDVRAAYEGFETFLDKFEVLVDIVLPVQEDPAFDHVLTPQHTGDTLVGHNRAADRFVFDNPSLSPNLEFSLVESTASSRGRDPLQRRGYTLETDAAQVKKFRPQDGDVFDFSGLSQDLSFSGYTPQPYAVWIDRYDQTASRYPIKVDLDGNPESIEMGVFLLPTSADRNGRTYDPMKTMTDDMFILA